MLHASTGKSAGTGGADLPTSLPIRTHSNNTGKPHRQERARELQESRSSGPEVWTAWGKSPIGSDPEPRVNISTPGI